MRLFFYIKPCRICTRRCYSLLETAANVSSSTVLMTAQLLSPRLTYVLCDGQYELNVPNFDILELLNLNDIITYKVRDIILLIFGVRYERKKSYGSARGHFIINITSIPILFQ
jgi:hypothetical protein